MLERIFNGMWLAAAMMVGIALGALMFSTWPAGFEPQQTITLAAAVVGAMGTWAVGIGAMHYAREAHALRIAENRAERTRSLIRVQANLINCQLAKSVYDEMVKEADGRSFTSQTKHIALNSILSILPTELLGPEFVIPEEHRPLCHSIDLAAMTLKAGAEQYFIFHPPTSTESQVEGEYFVHTIKQLNLLAKLAADLHIKMKTFWNEY